jgi:hypothetical protein
MSTEEASGFFQLETNWVDAAVAIVKVARAAATILKQSFIESPFISGGEALLRTRLLNSLSQLILHQVYFIPLLQLI